MKKKMKLTLTALLVVVLLATSIPVNAMNLEDETNAEEEYEMLWGLSPVTVSVKEIYGDVDNPQYRPLPDVKVRCSSFIPISRNGQWKFIWDIPTDEYGNSYFYLTFGFYLFKAIKEGYTDISLNQEIKPVNNLYSSSSDHHRFESYLGRLEDKGLLLEIITYARGTPTHSTEPRMQPETPPHQTPGRRKAPEVQVHNRNIYHRMTLCKTSRRS